MNILLIGNGFDLAHGLPTKYSDFLEFVKVVKQIIKICNGEDVGDIDWGNINNQIKEFIKNNLSNVRNNLYSQGEMWNDLIGDNIWIEYFLQCNMYQKDNWIDFESEISQVIQSLDNDMHELDEPYNIEDIIYDLSNEFLKNIYSDYIDAVQPINPVINGLADGISFKEIRNKLLNDLNKLIRALEIYLTEFVGQLEYKIILPDIKEAIEKSNKCMIRGIGVHICNVICFNYTNTYEKIYLESDITKNLIDYIHGKADISNTIESNNMVLGIDEYLSKKRRNKDTDFIAFKKYYQRIYKGTGCKYKELVDQVKENWEEETEESKVKIRKYISRGVFNYDDPINSKIHRFYIFGHSLDVTDKDILRDLILNDNVHTTIFYPSKEELGRKIANLVKIIGQYELIRRTGGSTKTINFEPQKEMEIIS